MQKVLFCCCFPLFSKSGYTVEALGIQFLPESTANKLQEACQPEGSSWMVSFRGVT